MIIPLGISDLLNEIKQMGFNFNLILKKDAGSEPLVVGNMPLKEVYEIIGRELTVEQGERTASPGSPNVSNLRTSRAGLTDSLSLPDQSSRAGQETSSPSSPNLMELATIGAGLASDSDSSPQTSDGSQVLPGASAVPVLHGSPDGNQPGATRPTEAQQGQSDSDSDFVSPPRAAAGPSRAAAGPSRVPRNTMYLYHDLPDLNVPFIELTDSAKRSFAVKLLRAISEPYQKLGEKVYMGYFPGWQGGGALSLVDIHQDTVH